LDYNGSIWGMEKKKDINRLVFFWAKKGKIRNFF
jgi:hypothetical protein